MTLFTSHRVRKIRVCLESKIQGPFTKVADVFIYTKSKSKHPEVTNYHFKLTLQQSVQHSKAIGKKLRLSSYKCAWCTMYPLIGISRKEFTLSLLIPLVLIVVCRRISRHNYTFRVWFALYSMFIFKNSASCRPARKQATEKVTPPEKVTHNDSSSTTKTTTI